VSAPPSGSTPSARAPARRDVFEADALAWLAANPAAPRTSVVTSLPDVSEIVPRDFDAWRAWFIDAARAIVRWLPERGVAMFFQSDVIHRGAWIDKGYLVMRAAEHEAAAICFHKIVCRKPPGLSTSGRASYSHLIAVAREPHPSTRPSPDVLPDAGFMPWSKAMGVRACALACEWLARETDARTIVDPFCGHGTALAVANEMGFDAIGVDKSARQCRAARSLRVTVG
jgi:hypothetical protein